jgi:hypothetical protein
VVLQNKPYIYGYARFFEKNGDFETGARVCFHANSGIVVTNKGSIQVKESSLTAKMEKPSHGKATS